METLEQYCDKYHDELWQAWLESGKKQGFRAFCYEAYKERDSGEQ